MKLIAISYGKKIAKFIATGYLITIKIALIMRIQVLLNCEANVFLCVGVYKMYTTNKESYLTIQLSKRNVFYACHASMVNNIGTDSITLILEANAAFFLAVATSSADASFMPKIFC